MKKEEEKKKDERKNIPLEDLENVDGGSRLLF